MDFNSLKNGLEKEIYSSLEDLYKRADLTKTERDIFNRYKKYCEHWLLRSKVLAHLSFDPKYPNFIKRLAGVISHLESETVSGDKVKKIKELFAYKQPIHRVYKTKNGLRSTQNSPIVENTYFELLILSFFVQKGFQVELSKSNEPNKKIPEFSVIKGEYRFAIEAKNLNHDSILDNIFGDSFTNGINYKRTQEEIEKGLERIKHQIRNNIQNAMAKIDSIRGGEQYLIFLSVYYNNNFIGAPAINYLNNLNSTWNQSEYRNLLGVVIPESERTLFIKNYDISSEAQEMLCENDICEFHKFMPIAS